MSYFTDHWSFDPFLIVVVVLVAWHEIGLARLARRSRPERTRQRRLRSLCVLRRARRAAHRGRLTHRLLGGRLLLRAHARSTCCSCSPRPPGRGRRALAAAARRAARSGGPAQRPARLLRDAGHGRSGRPPDFLLPAVGLGDRCSTWSWWSGTFPALFDLAAAEPGRAHLADARELLPGRGAVLAPVHPVPAVPAEGMPLVSQAAALIATNVVMWVLAMAMSIFSAARLVHRLRATCPG